MHFTKMHGAGNDFIIFDAMCRPFALAGQELAELVRRVCDRHTGVGADGVMVLQSPQGQADVAMRFYNADGSMGEMCGNGARCVCRYATEHGYAGETVRVETTAGLVTGQRQENGRFRIRLNTPSVLETERVLEVDGERFTCGYVELGSPGIPHLTLEIPMLRERAAAAEQREALRKLGSRLRYHPTLKKGANVNFYQPLGENRVYELTYERGVEDFTLACGTGTGSVAAVLAVSGRANGTRLAFEMAGGQLDAEVEIGNGCVCDLFLTGPTQIICTGELSTDFLDSVKTE